MSIASLRPRFTATRLRLVRRSAGSSQHRAAAIVLVDGFGERLRIPADPRDSGPYYPFFHSDSKYIDNKGRKPFLRVALGGMDKKLGQEPSIAWFPSTNVRT